MDYITSIIHFHSIFIFGFTTCSLLSSFLKFAFLYRSVSISVPLITLVAYKMKISKTHKQTSWLDTGSKRLNLTVSRALYDDIMFLSHYMKISASGLINQLISEPLPYMANELRKVAASPNPDEAVRRLRGESADHIKSQYESCVSTLSEVSKHEH